MLFGNDMPGNRDGKTLEIIKNEVLSQRKRGTYA